MAKKGGTGRAGKNHRGRVSLSHVKGSARHSYHAAEERICQGEGKKEREGRRKKGGGKRGIKVKKDWEMKKSRR